MHQPIEQGTVETDVRSHPLPMEQVRRRGQTGRWEAGVVGQAGRREAAVVAVGLG